MMEMRWRAGALWSPWSPVIEILDRPGSEKVKSATTGTCTGHWVVLGMAPSQCPLKLILAPQWAPPRSKEGATAVNSRRGATSCDPHTMAN